MLQASEIWIIFMYTDVWSWHNDAAKPHKTRLYEIRSLFCYIEHISKTWPAISRNTFIWHFRKETKYYFRGRAVGEQITLMLFLRYSPNFHWFVLRVHEITVSKFGNDKVNKCTGNFMVAPCINNTKHFIFQIIHTNYKTLRLLK